MQQFVGELLMHNHTMLCIGCYGSKKCEQGTIEMCLLASRPVLEGVEPTPLEK